ALRRWLPSPHHVFCHGGLPDIDAKLEQFAVNPWCSSLASMSGRPRSEEHTSELQSLTNLVCRLLLEKKKNLPTFVIVANTLTDTTHAPSPSPLSRSFPLSHSTAATEIYTLSLHDALPI